MIGTFFVYFLDRHQILNQKEIILKHNHIVVISATRKYLVTRPRLGVLDICEVLCWARVTHPTCRDWDIFYTRFGNFTTVIKSIPSCPVSAGPGRVKPKKFTHTESVEQARSAKSEPSI